jgi:hypothetical protein
VKKLLVDFPRARIDNTRIKAIARGFRWRKLLEIGVYGTLEEIAAAKKINPSYDNRLLRTTLLAPEVEEAILDGRQPADTTLAELMQRPTVLWRGFGYSLLHRHCRQSPTQ